tara:strand:+ start:845 stop:2269 length:1425 start_codon:yes stop_codon:yes gene_type:complete
MKEENKGTVIVNNLDTKEDEMDEPLDEFEILGAPDSNEEEFSEAESDDGDFDVVNQAEEKEIGQGSDNDVVKDSKNDLQVDDSFPSSDDLKPKFVSSTDIIRIIFSRKTLYHVLVLFAFLTFFGVMSYFESDFVVEIIIVFGYGVSIGYFLTAVLNRFDEVRNLSRSEKPTSLIMPLTFSLLASSFIWAGLHNSTHGPNFERALKLGLVIIFVIWQFAQAWWMRIPFKEFAIRRMNSYSSEGQTQLGKIGNILAPAFWALMGLLLFYFISTYVPSFSETFDQMFIIFWLMFMLLLGFISFYFLRKMHDDFWLNPKVASFSAFFALGYWGFLSYHAGILLYSMFNEPSFVYDLFFMIFTIMLVIYSLSVQTLRAEARRGHLSDSNHYVGKASGLMNKHNVIFYSISFTIVYGASSFFLATDSSFIGDVKNVSRLSHLIVIVSGIIVLLLVNYNLLTGKGLMTKGFIESMRTPKNN